MSAAPRQFRKTARSHTGDREKHEQRFYGCIVAVLNSPESDRDQIPARQSIEQLLLLGDHLHSSSGSKATSLIEQSHALSIPIAHATHGLDNRRTFRISLDLVAQL